MFGKLILVELRSEKSKEEEFKDVSGGERTGFGLSRSGEKRLGEEKLVRDIMRKMQIVLVNEYYYSNHFHPRRCRRRREISLSGLFIYSFNHLIRERNVVAGRRRRYCSNSGAAGGVGEW